MQNGLANPDNAGAASTDYLHLFGLTGLAYMWALIAKAVLAPGRRRRATPVYAKLILARFFHERMLPETGGASGPPLLPAPRR